MEQEKIANNNKTIHNAHGYSKLKSYMPTATQRKSWPPDADESGIEHAVKGEGKPKASRVKKHLRWDL